MKICWRDFRKYSYRIVSITYFNAFSIQYFLAVCFLQFWYSNHIFPTLNKHRHSTHTHTHTKLLANLTCFKPIDSNTIHSSFTHSHCKSSVQVIYIKQKIFFQLLRKLMKINVTFIIMLISDSYEMIGFICQILQLKKKKCLYHFIINNSWFNPAAELLFSTVTDFHWDSKSWWNMTK